jgi:hypothetical protein
VPGDASPENRISPRYEGESFPPQLVRQPLNCVAEALVPIDDLLKCCVVDVPSKYLCNFTDGVVGARHIFLACGQARVRATLNARANDRYPGGTTMPTSLQSLGCASVDSITS